MKKDELLAILMTLLLVPFWEEGISEEHTADAISDAKDFAQKILRTAKRSE